MNEWAESTVLVVDDAPDSLSLINDTLEQAGLDTLVALEGRQALTIAGKLKPDIILLDALLPGMDGFEICRQLKTDPQLASTPVIFMTGLSDDDSILRGLEAGGVDYLTKPVNPGELLARIRVHLRNAQITHSAQQALDRAGQNIFTVDRTGEILWATPRTLAMFAGAGPLWQRDRLGPGLAAWLAGDPVPGAQFAPAAAESDFEITLLERRAGGQYLLRAADARGPSSEEKLRRALNLTVRESQVLLWLANGKSNKDIAQILGMGVRTVNKHLEQVFPKLGVENRTAAAGIALRHLV
jgi:DNA-binding NarL/FixJ family response regulator